MYTSAVFLLTIFIAPSLSFVVTVRPHSSNSIGDDNQKPVIREAYPIAADSNILKIPARGPKQDLPEVKNFVGLQQTKNVDGLYTEGSTINMEPEGDNTLKEDTRSDDERKISYTDAVMALAMWHLTKTMNDYQIQKGNHMSSERPILVEPNM